MDPDEKDSKGMPLTCRAVFIIGPDRRLKLSLLYRLPLEGTLTRFFVWWTACNLLQPARWPLPWTEGGRQLHGGPWCEAGGHGQSVPQGSESARSSLGEGLHQDHAPAGVGPPSVWTTHTVTDYRNTQDSLFLVLPDNAPGNKWKSREGKKKKKKKS